MRRIAQIVHLKPSALAAYKECHANVWPEVLQQIKECNIRDCTLLISSRPFFLSMPSTSLAVTWGLIFGLVVLLDSIFYDNDRTLFATFKYVGDDYEGDMEKMRANPKVREWWAMTDGMQESPIPGAVGSAEGPGWWKVLEEVFYTD
ncbi:hypothetical protein BJX63DRAFT_212906 [Aspergillus granulosus]|uniref:Rhamnose mutarotase n=1 Tax=Aspergillus granulosus TaxID=176169 RepID=A0ABR4HDZ6_9EURO